MRFDKLVRFMITVKGVGTADSGEEGQDLTNLRATKRSRQRTCQTFRRLAAFVRIP